MFRRKTCLFIIQKTQEIAFSTDLSDFINNVATHSKLESSAIRKECPIRIRSRYIPVVELLSPQPGERILDPGCGDGALSLKLAGLGCKVSGIDSSAEMKEPEQIITSVWRTLKPGGHFTGKLRGYGNIVTIIDALESSVSVRGQIVLNP